MRATNRIKLATSTFAFLVALSVAHAAHAVEKTAPPKPPPPPPPPPTSHTIPGRWIEEDVVVMTIMHLL